MDEDLPGDSLGVFPGLVLDMEIHPGVAEEDLGQVQLLLLETDEEGSVPGLVPGVPLHAGLLGEQLHTSHSHP